MKALISIAILLGVIFVAWKGIQYWDQVNKQEGMQERAAQSSQIDPRRLPGLAQDLELSLDKAYQGGARSLKAWLKAHKDSPKVQDPRLAWIELDYVVKVAQDDPMEAKKIFSAVKARVTKDSPVYSRVKELEKPFGDN
jgi:hypothetical protein